MSLYEEISELIDLKTEGPITGTLRFSGMKTKLICFTTLFVWQITLQIGTLISLLE